MDRESDTNTGTASQTQIYPFGLTEARRPSTEALENPCTLPRLQPHLEEALGRITPGLWVRWRGGPVTNINGYSTLGKLAPN